jgi:ribosomal protein S18 acetylase RimI-like enzyme
VRQCAFCNGNAIYRDGQTGQVLCLEHARLEIVAAGRRPPSQPLEIRPATEANLARIEALSLHFWDETDVDCFDRQYDVLACPAYLACAGDEVVGTVSYAVEEAWGAVVVVILNILPDYQRRGGGWALLGAVRDEAAQRGLGRLLIATANDDLPALALYQRYGFCIIDVITGRVAQDHGGEFPGLAGIPVRDEIRLEYRLGG